MTFVGWVMMIVSVGFVVGLALFCFYRVLTTPEAQEHIHGAADIDIGEHDRQADA